MMTCKLTYNFCYKKLIILFNLCRLKQKYIYLNPNQFSTIYIIVFLFKFYFDDFSYGFYLLLGYLLIRLFSVVKMSIILLLILIYCSLVKNYF